jgi:multimeric flavodoxin WrbA
MKIIALCGSIRSNTRAKDFLLQTIHISENLDSYLKAISTQTHPRQQLSNSEILCGIALMGAKSQGYEVDFFSLLELFKRQERRVNDLTPETYGLDPTIVYRDLLTIDKASLDTITAKLHAAIGIIIISPVYFGDRSSVTGKFMQLAMNKQFLQEKVVATCSVGAKRNGGQETTNIFLLYEALNLGAYIVGNGPKTSQYGGTAWAGDKGKVLNDALGIETTFGTGVRVAQVCNILKNRASNGKYLVPRTNIVILITMDTPDHKLKHFLTKYLQNAHLDTSDISFKVIELINNEIERCIACNICPIPKYLEQDPSTNQDTYACIIRKQSDSLDHLRDELLKADGVILAGLNSRDMSDVLSRYQLFMERSRFIRRNDFEMTNIPLCGLVVSEVGAYTNPIHNLKVMASFMRHNGIMLKSITITVWHDQIIDPGYDDIL